MSYQPLSLQSPVPASLYKQWQTWKFKETGSLLKFKPFPYSDLLAIIADWKEFAVGIAVQPKSSAKYSLSVVGKEVKYSRDTEIQDYSFWRTESKLRVIN